ncbi:MAG: glycosyltransferase family 2 protein, partial [Proteobacteria bacterium]|nr:glycosyltransferase family 2 protein [Pseudomonadota bacterium]
QGTTTGSVEHLRERSRMPVYLDTRNRLLLTRDLRPGAFLSAALFVIAFQFLRCVRHRALRQYGYVVQGWLAGLRNERGAPAWVPGA